MKKLKSLPKHLPPRDKNPKSKKVSIIVPVYNVEKYLRECLDSLVNQTLKDIEIICINDASPDNSLKILKEYKKKYPKLIKIIDLKNNVGVGYARNHGLDKAQGEYIAFVDPDDYVDVTMCEKLYAFAKKNGADLVPFNYIALRHKNIKYKNTIHNCFDKLQLRVPKSQFALKAYNGVVLWFYHRVIWEDIRFPNCIYEDLAVKIFPIIHSGKIMYLDEYFYFYREKREGSIMNSPLSFISYLQVFEFIMKESKRIKLFDRDGGEEIVFKLIADVFCGILFKSRRTYESNVITIYNTILKKHFEDMSQIYPNYQYKIIEFSGEKYQKKLKFLFAHPFLFLSVLHFKFGAKNLWHKLFG